MNFTIRIGKKIYDVQTDNRHPGAIVAIDGSVDKAMNMAEPEFDKIASKISNLIENNSEQGYY